MINILLSILFQYSMTDYGISNVELCMLEDYIHTFVN